MNFEISLNLAYCNPHAQLGRPRPRRLTGGPHLPATAHIRARALSLPLSLPLPGRPDLSAPNRSHGLPLSLAARWDLPVSVDCPFAAHPRWSTDPAYQPLPSSLTSRPCSSSWMRQRPRIFRPRPTCPSPFLHPTPTHSLPSPYCALS
jgi:hypothetical protein